MGQHLSSPIEYVPGEQNDTTVPGVAFGKDAFDKISTVTKTTTIAIAMINAGSESAIPDLLYCSIFLSLFKF